MSNTAPQTKTAITLLQELLGAHATRIAGYKHLNEQSPASDKEQFTQRIEQSNQYVAQLMEELAAYGDASQSEVNHNTPLNKQWTAMNDEAADKKALANAEKALIDQYQQGLEEVTHMPDSLREILEKQQNTLRNQIS